MPKSKFHPIKAGLLLFGMLFLPFSLAAQSLIPVALHWKSAMVVLTNSDTLKGSASLTLPEDMIRLSQPDGSSANFLPAEVRAFYVQEPTGIVPTRRSGNLLLEQRQYAPYLWNQDKDYGTRKAPALFVVVVPGKYSLLLREHKEQLQISGGPSLAGLALSSAAASAQLAPGAPLAERFYLSISGQEVKWLRNPKTDLLKNFPEREKQIRKFAQQNDLSFNRIDHLARIVAYINTL